MHKYNNKKKELITQQVNESQELSETQDIGICVYPQSPKCNTQFILLIFERNDNLKNDSEQSLVYTGDCYVIEIKDTKALVYTYIQNE